MKPMYLGVSFSSRIMGLAVLAPPTTLIDYSLKLYKEPWTPLKMGHLLASLTSAIERYSITHVVLSIPSIHYQPEHFTELWTEFVLLVQHRELDLKMYRHDEMQMLCGNKERMTRRSLMEAIVTVYPELEPIFLKEIRNKNKYHYKMFEAIGAAMLAMGGVE